MHHLHAFEGALVDWMEEQHEAEVGPYIGNCVFGAIKLRSKRTFESLVDAWALLSDWNVITTSSHWPPIPYFMLAEDQLARGRFDVGLAFLLVFCGLLRISEVAGLRGKRRSRPESLPLR